MNERLEQKLRTRRKLVEAALAMSAERGFGTLSLREVAKAAGITPAAFYRHFHNMDELGLVLIDEVGLGLRQLLRDSRRNFDREGSAVRKSVEAFIRYLVENANLFRVLQGERQGASPEFRKALYAEFGRFVEEVAEDLERGAERLQQPLTSPALAAEAIVAVAFTVGAEALDLPKHRIGELTERLVGQMKMILRGAMVDLPSPRHSRKQAHPQKRPQNRLPTTARLKKPS